MRQQEQATEASQEQPIWVQDLLAWLEKIQQQDLTVEEWIRQVQDILAELPGQGLPEEFWPKRQANGEVEADHSKVAAKPPLSDEDRVRIWEELNKASRIADESSRSSALAAVVSQIPASEPQLLQAALDAANCIADESSRSSVLAAVVLQIPASEPQLLQAALDAANCIEHDVPRWSALVAVAAQIPMSEPQLLQAALDAANRIRFDFRF